MRSVDVEAVCDILREAVATVISPRFRALAASEIEEKAPGEVVTIADREAEAFISSRLEARLPGVPVVGEEAASDQPDLIEAVRTEPMVWLLDPVDGTSNFAAGNPLWAVLAALVVHGETVASWTCLPDGRIYVAELGSGAWLNGVRLLTQREPVDLAGTRGAILERFLTDDERGRLTPLYRQFGAVLPGLMCAGFEYPEIVHGGQEFALFQRVLPWDHAPGSLLLEEAGGCARHPNGDRYRLDHRRRGLLLASSEATWEAVRDVLYGGVPQA